MLKRISIILLSIAMLCGMCAVSVGAESVDFSKYQMLIQDGFDQGEYPFVYENNFSNLAWCIDYKNNLTYIDLLETDYKDTVTKMFDIFDIGEISDYETTYRIAKEYFPEEMGRPYKIFKKDEIDILFNAYFGTNIDVLSLPNLYTDSDWCLARIYDDYFVYFTDYINTDYFHAKWKGGYKIGVYEYWKWQLYEGNPFDPSSKVKSDIIHTVSKEINVCGYKFPGISYIGFKPPSDQLVRKFENDEAAPITVTLNGNKIDFDQPPIIQNDRTLVPLRAIFEALGAIVEWDGNTQTVTAAKDGTTIKLTIGDYAIYKNGNKFDIDVPAMLVNGRTLIPVRAVSEAFNCSVDWDGETRTVKILHTQTDNTVAEALTQFAKNNLKALYEDDYVKKYTYTDVRFLLADMSGDDKPELIAVGVDDNEMRYYEIYSYDNGKIINIEKNHFGYARGGAMYLLWHDNGVRLAAESSSSGTGFLMRLMKYQNGDWVDIYNSHMDIDYANDAKLKGYIINGEYVSEEEFVASREEIAKYNVTITDFVKF